MRTRSLIHWAVYSVPLLAMLAVVWFGFSTEADVVIFFKDHRATHPVLKAVMQIITDWSNPLFYGIYAAMLFKAWRSKNREHLRFIVILLIVQAVIAGLAVHFLKSFIGRPRPGEGEWFDPLTSRGANHSLPSGHTTEITGWTLPLSLWIARSWVTILLGLFAGVVAFSRIYLGWHHPSDVFFAWMLGSVAGLAVITLLSTSFFTRKG